MNNNEGNYNPTCIFTGRKDNLLMHAHRNEKGEMVGWIFLHESFKDVASDYEMRIYQKKAMPTMPDTSEIIIRPKLDNNPHA